MLHKQVATCHVCRHDKTLRELKAKVVEVQVETRVEWRASPIAQIHDHLMPDSLDETGSNNWFLLNDKERPTVIPSYSLYDKTWKKAMFLNPFEVDWNLFEIHGSQDMEYVLSLMEILEDQKDLWCSDENTEGQAIMVLFTRFIKVVRRLVMYCMGIESLTY